jgi:hypothetical protein
VHCIEYQLGEAVEQLLVHGDVVGRYHWPDLSEGQQYK